MVVDTSVTRSYITEQFFEEIGKLDYETKKLIIDKSIVENGQLTIQRKDKTNILG